ncbi:MAG: enoyl-CoA hydratase [Solirubrobacterales bacterium]|jgi:enoyl-CoA hydratase/carnithine racemase|nr:enoyl-CoA hydratase [Solirubrobacterales bacterium]
MSLWNVEERSDGIIIAAYNNPPHNYFVAEAAGELAAMLPRWRDADVRVVILTGAVADRYITHYSVEELLDLTKDREGFIRGTNDLIAGWHTLLQAISYLDKPVLAAMTGTTGGGGLELSLNCDVRIMQRGDYMIGFPEASLGILTGTGSQLLARAIGRSRALDFLLRSRYVTPEGALELGIVNELADDALARAIEIAEKLAKASPVALTAAKRSIVRGANLPMQEGLRVEAEEWLKTMATQEAIDLMTDYVSRPVEERLDWVREHGAWPEPGAATGS